MLGSKYSLSVDSLENEEDISDGGFLRKIREEYQVFAEGVR